MATKILLVEDDKSLREIYGVRLMAEGYDIVSASDGEQALAVAIKERPMLIITDVMMPKISGFDMLDILRSTAETKEIKVIMMTALSSDDQRMRGERMGADRYLVKSQVGIEDVVRTVHEVLGDAGASAVPAAAPVAAAAATTPATPPSPTPAPATTSPADTPAQPSPGPAVPPPTVATPAPAPDTTATVVPPAPTYSSITPEPPSSKQRVIQPINDITAKVNINELLDRELAKEAGLDMMSRPEVATTEQEKTAVADQIEAVVQAPAPAETTSAATPPPTDTPTAASTPRPASATPAAPPRPNAPLQTPPRPPVVQ